MTCKPTLGSPLEITACSPGLDRLIHLNSDTRRQTRLGGCTICSTLPVQVQNLTMVGGGQTQEAHGCP